MEDAAAIRAAMTRDILDTARAVRPTAVAGLPAADLAQVERAVRLAWIPIETHLRLMDALRTAVGDMAFQALGRRTMERSFQQPTFKALVDGAVRLFGLDPGSVVKVVPNGWSLVTRGLGRIEIAGAPRQASRGEGAMRLRLVGFPARHVGRGTMFLGLAGNLEGILDVCKRAGRVGIAAQDAAAGAVEFEMSWRS